MWALARTRCTLAVAGAGRALPVLLGHGLDGGHQLRSLDVDPAVRLAQAQQLRRALAVHGRQRRLVLRAAGVLRKARPGLRKRWSCRGSRAPPLPDTPSQRPVRLARPQAQSALPLVSSTLPDCAQPAVFHQESQKRAGQASSHMKVGRRGQRHGIGEGGAPGAPTGTAGTGSSRARTTARPQTCAARSPQARACAPCQSPLRPARPACRRRSAPRPRRPPSAAAAAAARPPASPALAPRATRAHRRVRGCAAPRPRPRAGPGRRSWPHTRGSRPASPPAGRPSSGPRAAAAAGSGTRRRLPRHPKARSARRPVLASPAAFTRTGHLRTVARLNTELLTRTCPFPHLSAHRNSTRE